VFLTLLNIGMEYLFLFQLGWGVTGAAGAVVLSQAIACAILIRILASRVSIRNIKTIDMETCSRVLRSTGVLMIRTYEMISLLISIKIHTLSG
jgi:Na+-driven multidrug efflux pump